MTRVDLMRDHYASTLVDLCRTRRLADISVSDVVEAANTARSTFYTHFSDLDDLVCFAASRPMLNSGLPVFDVENVRAFWNTCRENRHFYGQLHENAGFTGFRASFERWLKQKFRQEYILEGMPRDEVVYRECAIDALITMHIGVFFDWLSNGMEAPVDVMIKVLLDASPSFAVEGMGGTPTGLPDYPK